MDGATRIIRGCRCQKSRCLKKYCDCYAANLPCGKNCICEDCGNQDKRKSHMRRKLNTVPATHVPPLVPLASTLSIKSTSTLPSSVARGLSNSVISSVSEGMPNSVKAFEFSIHTPLSSFNQPFDSDASHGLSEFELDTVGGVDCEQGCELIAYLNDGIL